TLSSNKKSKFYSHNIRQYNRILDILAARRGRRGGQGQDEATKIGHRESEAAWKMRFKEAQAAARSSNSPSSFFPPRFTCAALGPATNIPDPHQQSAASAVRERASLGQSGPGSIGGVGRHLSGGPDLSVSAPKKCQLISVPMCRNIGYNYTSMPNQYGDDTQEEAASEVHQFWPLVEISCSQDLRFFLCSMYVPICMHNYDRHLPACRSVCLRAKKGCAPLMRQYGFSWPEKMDCSKLPGEIYLPIEQIYYRLSR
uniref:FZ domain-containing protein n=1 Tax=Macrostomum lignano TaxID=282301 RepID=A0A1I8FM45_9PLAT